MSGRAVVLRKRTVVSRGKGKGYQSHTLLLFPGAGRVPELLLFLFRSSPVTISSYPSPSPRSSQPWFETTPRRASRYAYAQYAYATRVSARSMHVGLSALSHSVSCYTYSMFEIWFAPCCSPSRPYPYKTCFDPKPRTADCESVVRLWEQRERKRESERRAAVLPFVFRARGAGVYKGRRKDHGGWNEGKGKGK